MYFTTKYELEFRKWSQIISFYEDKIDLKCKQMKINVFIIIGPNK